MKPLAVWLDDFALAALPGVEQALVRTPAMVMRSFARVPNPAMVSQLGTYRQVAVVGGKNFTDLVQRLERASATLKLGLIGIMPSGSVESASLHGPGVVDLIPAGYPEAATRIALMSEVPIISGARLAKSRSAIPLVATPGELPFAMRAPPVRVLSTPGASLGIRRPVAIASSTGGAWVLSDLLRTVDRQRVGPVLLAQHMDTEFLPFFAQWLAEETGWQPTLVSGRTRLSAEGLYLAIGGCDLCVDRSGQEAYAAPATSHFVPSADRLFSGFAEAFGAAGIGLVLSGMGSDGARGLAEVVRRGGQGVCQQPSSAIVASMPENALTSSRGAVPVPPELLAAYLAQGGGLGVEERK